MSTTITDPAAELEAALVAFYARKYVQSRSQSGAMSQSHDRRQKELGLAYMTVETHDLAEETARFVFTWMSEKGFIE